jgi:hypothetical protein
MLWRIRTSDFMKPLAVIPKVLGPIVTRHALAGVAARDLEELALEVAASVAHAAKPTPLSRGIASFIPSIQGFTNSTTSASIAQNQI